MTTFCPGVHGGIGVQLPGENVFEYDNHRKPSLCTEAKTVCVTVHCLNDHDWIRTKPSVLIRVSVTYILSCVDWRVVGPLIELI